MGWFNKTPEEKAAALKAAQMKADKKFIEDKKMAEVERQRKVQLIAAQERKEYLERESGGDLSEKNKEYLAKAESQPKPQSGWSKFASGLGVIYNKLSTSEKRQMQRHYVKHHKALHRQHKTRATYKYVYRKPSHKRSRHRRR